MAIIFVIIALLVYIGSVFIFLPGLLIMQFISGTSLKMANFWLWGILISAAIFFIFIILTGNPGAAGGLYLGICILSLFVTIILSLADSTFFKKLIYNTWYWEFAYNLRDNLALQIEKDRALKNPPVIGMVSANNANVRRGPGKEYEVVSSLNKGDEARILLARDEWVLIQYDTNHEGWIHKSLIKLKDLGEIKVKGGD